MKKFIVIITVMAMVLALAACQGKGKGEPKTEPKTEQTTQETTAEPTTEEKTTQAPVDDTIVYHLTGIDSSSDWYTPMGVDSMTLTASGRLSIATNGALKEKVGAEVVLANDVLAADLFNYGNGGYRVILFVRQDGTLSAVNPNDLIMKQTINVMDNIGGLKNVVDVSEETDEYETVIVATTQDGSKTVIDSYLN